MFEAGAVAGPNLTPSAWYRPFASPLARPPRSDGRVLVIAIVVSYFGVIVAFSLFTDYVSFWTTFAYPPFLDLRQVPAGVLCAERGYDPLRFNPCDPLG